MSHKHLKAAIGQTVQRDREDHDFYFTNPDTLEQLLPYEEISHRVWECACGEGHLSKVLEAHGHEVLSTDLIDRGYGIGGVDFLTCTEPFDGDILTNPPFNLSNQFVLKALELIPEGHKVIFLLRLTWLEGKQRYKLIFKNHPPKKIYVSSGRTSCGQQTGSAIAFAWFVWVKGFKGTTELGWFNIPDTSQMTIFDF